MASLDLSALLVAHGVVTCEQLDELQSELPEGASLEDVLLERGLVDQETLDGLLSLAETPLPDSGVIAPGTPVDGDETVWEYEVPSIPGEDSGEVSQDAVTGRFGAPNKSTTARWAETPIEETGSLKSRTTRWEIPVPDDNPTGEWDTATKTTPGLSVDLSGLEEFEALEMGTTSIGPRPGIDDQGEATGSEAAGSEPAGSEPAGSEAAGSEPAGDGV
ncbi:MAG: hypothetical protein JKY65_06480 [Planctomycetes bacterium]|nr:hypothetical protein [Planctomycetota bacterium]